MKLSNRTYDILKKVSLMMVPLATFIASIAKIVGFDGGTIIAAIISAFGLFLGDCLIISSRNYSNDKDISELSDAEDTEGVG